MSERTHLMVFINSPLLSHLEALGLLWQELLIITGCHLCEYCSSQDAIALIFHRIAGGVSFRLSVGLISEGGS